MALTPSAVPAPGARPLAQLRDAGLVAAVALCLVITARLLLVIWQVRLHAQPRPPTPQDADEGYHRPWTSLEQQYHWLGTIYSLVLLVSAVTFLLWLRQARTTARALPAAQERYRDVWVYLGWVFPVVCLWFPRGIVVDVWRSATPEGTSRERRSVPWYVNVWWLLWLGAALPNGGTLFDRDDRALDTVHDSMPTLLLSDALIVAAGVFAVLVIRRLTRDQVAAAGGDRPGTL